MIANIGTNSKNLNREMYAIMERTTIQAKELARILKEQSSRQLLSNIKNDDIRECESITLSLKDKLLSPTLDKGNDILECNKIPLSLKGDFQVPSLVEINEPASAEEPLLKTMQVEEQHP